MDDGGAHPLLHGQARPLAGDGSSAARRSLRAGRAHESALDRLRASLEGALPLDGDRRRHWLVTLACCVHATGDGQLATAQRDAYREFRDHVADLVRESGIATDEAR